MRGKIRLDLLYHLPGAVFVSLLHYHTVDEGLAVYRLILNTGDGTPIYLCL